MGRLIAYLKTRSRFGVESRTAHHDQSSLIAAWDAALLDSPDASGVADVSGVGRLSNAARANPRGKLVLLPGARLAMPDVAARPDVLLWSAEEQHGLALPTTDYDNPFDVAAAAHAEIRAVPLYRLRLPRRAANVFANARLETVGDVLALGFDGLKRLPQLGAGSVRDFAHAISEFLLAGAGEGRQPASSTCERPPSDVVDRNDPFELVNRASPQLLTVSLRRLRLPRRAVNVFMNARLETVGDVIALGFHGLMELPQFGAGSLRDLGQAISEFVEEQGDDGLQIERARGVGTSSATAPVQSAKSNSAAKSLLPEGVQEVGFAGRFYDEFVGSLQRLSPRDAVVLAGRLGYGGPAQTLDELGALLGVTRERARQLEKRAVETVKRQDWLHVLLRCAATLLEKRIEPLYLDLIAAEDVRFDGFQDHLSVLGRLVTEFSDEPIHVWPLNDRLIATRLPEDAFGSLRQRILTHLESQLSTKLTVSETRLVVESICAGSGAPELTGALWELLKPYLHFSSDGGAAAHLVAVGRGLRPALLSIFDESERPLHFREVRERLEGRGYEVPGDNGLRTAIRSSGMLLYGRSTYGTIRHLGLEPDVIAELRDELVEIIASEPEHQWHAAELLEELQRRGFEATDDMDPYSVGALLDGVSEVAFLGRLVWTAKQRVPLSPSDRREVADLVEAVLVDAGRPLRKVELRRAIQRARGLNSNFLPQPTDRVIRLGGGKWGLVDRDTRLPLDVCETSLRALEAVLFRRGRALHTSEIRPALSEKGIELAGDAVEELIGRAQVDPRFRVARGNFVALPGWDSLGRATMSEAQEQVLAQLRDPRTLDEIQRELESITERPINRWHVASWLNRAGATYDSRSARWVLRDESQDSEIEE